MLTKLSATQPTALPLSGSLADLVRAAADLTLVVDAEDRVEDLAHNLRDLPEAWADSCRGRPIADLVEPASRAALASMLREARRSGAARDVEIVHALGEGATLPVRYSAFRVGEAGGIVLVGRDLRALADLRSQLLANQQALERDRSARRQSEAHYRFLFETAPEAVLVVEAPTWRIREANPRAVALLGAPGARLVGKTLPAAFKGAPPAEIRSVLAGVLASGARASLAVETGGNRRRFVLSVEPLRAADLNLAVVRVAASDARDETAAAEDAALGEVVRNATEGVLLTDEMGTIAWANEAFLSLAGLSTAARAVGRPLGAFLQWRGASQDAVLADLKRRGALSRMRATLLCANNGRVEMELSAVSRSDPARPGYALVMRADAPGEAPAGALAGTLDSLTGMVGRVPMKEMVRDTTDVIERMCIEAALKLSGQNRASAARSLGLSRQALYLKMHRFGLVDES